MAELGVGMLDDDSALSSDVAADARWFTEPFGAECVFVVDSMAGRRDF